MVVTGPVPPGDREALAELIHNLTIETAGSAEDAADQILAQWRLVPVEQEDREILLLRTSLADSQENLANVRAELRAALDKINRQRGNY